MEGTAIPRWVTDRPFARIPVNAWKWRKDRGTVLYQSVRHIFVECHVTVSSSSSVISVNALLFLSSLIALRLSRNRTIRCIDAVVFCRFVTGSRMDKHWFIVRDTSLKTDRLVTLAPLSRNCSLSITPLTKNILNDLFLALQHPYICPIFDIDFLEFENENYAIVVQPISQGSLKDLIYGVSRGCLLAKKRRQEISECRTENLLGFYNCHAVYQIERTGWNEDWNHKYGSRGKGLPLPQVQQMGRQVLEALVFLKERGFPTVIHLHSGNVLIQNGVARLAGLENTLLGFTSRIHPLIASRISQTVSIDMTCFGKTSFRSILQPPLLIISLFLNNQPFTIFQVICCLRCVPVMNYHRLSQILCICPMLKCIHKY